MIRRSIGSSTPRLLKPAPTTANEGVEAWAADVRETLSEFEVAPDEFLDASEQLVCPVRIRVRGKASGVKAELRETHVWTLADGRAVRMKVYPDHAEALEAAGLRE